MRFEELYERRQRRTLTRAAAVEMLGVPERPFRRWGGARGCRIGGSAEPRPVRCPWRRRCRW